MAWVFHPSIYWIPWRRVLAKFQVSLTGQDDCEGVQMVVNVPRQLKHKIVHVYKFHISKQMVPIEWPCWTAKVAPVSVLLYQFYVYQLRFGTYYCYQIFSMYLAFSLPAKILILFWLLVSPVLLTPSMDFRQLEQHTCSNHEELALIPSPVIPAMPPLRGDHVWQFKVTPP